MSRMRGNPGARTHADAILDTDDLGLEDEWKGSRVFARGDPHRARNPALPLYQGMLGWFGGHRSAQTERDIGHVKHNPEVERR